MKFLTWEDQYHREINFKVVLFLCIVVLSSCRTSSKQIDKSFKYTNVGIDKPKYKSLECRQEIAEEHFYEVVSTSYSHDSALCKICSENIKQKKVLIENFIKTAKDYIFKCKFDEARFFLDGGLMLDPEQLELKHLRACIAGYFCFDAYHSKQTLFEIIITSTKAIELNSKNTAAYYKRALAKKALSNYKGAEEDMKLYEKYRLESDPKSLNGSPCFTEYWN